MEQDLPPMAQAIMLAIFSHYRPKKGEMRPCSKRLARLAKCCNRTIFRWLNWLESEGWLIRETRTDKETNRLLANRYRPGTKLSHFFQTVSRATDNRSHTKVFHTNGKKKRDITDIKNQKNPVFSQSELAKAARPGESWDDVRTRLSRTRQ
jgi:DNA-binding transcriptional MocR family regulator